LTWTEQVELRDLSSANCDIVYDFIQLPSGVVLAGCRQAASIFASSDDGASWWLVSELAAGGTAVHSFMLLANGEVLAGTDDSGKVYQSSNSGQTWAELSDTGETTVETLSRTHN